MFPPLRALTSTFHFSKKFFYLFLFARNHSCYTPRLAAVSFSLPLPSTQAPTKLSKKSVSPLRIFPSVGAGRSDRIFLYACFPFSPEVVTSSSGSDVFKRETLRYEVRT